MICDLSLIKEERRSFFSSDSDLSLSFVPKLNHDDDDDDDDERVRTLFMS